MIENPYGDLAGGQWLIGNLHAHTTRSDGQREPQDVIDDYAERGHGFLMLSDHDIYTSLRDYAQLDPRGMCLIPGNEISANGPHLLHVGATCRVDPEADRQRVIDQVQATGGFAIFNHPNWYASFNHCPQEVLERCQGYLGLEIYNAVISRLEGSPYATNRWDLLLTAGRRVWGFANDDSHWAQGEVGLGWNAVYVAEPTREAVLEALCTGRFYASTGVEIYNVEVDGDAILVETENAARIVALREGARRFAQVDAPCLEVNVPEGARYVRFECWGSGESFAWTQPLFVT
ncbi:MAG: CehA/McbA family metallohydrolase [Candidatus Latescibacterota bacterium]